MLSGVALMGKYPSSDRKQILEDGLPVHPDLSRVGPVHARQHAQQCALAGAVRAHQSEDLAVGDIGGQIPDGRDITE